MLHGLVQTGPTVAEALQMHRRLFGFAPVHPLQGQWVVQDGKLLSSSYGRPSAEKQPPFRPGDRAFGLLQGISSANVEMGFEEDGLRTKVKWQFQAKRSITSTPALAEDLVIVGSMDSTVYAVDAGSGWAISARTRSSATTRSGTGRDSTRTRRS